MNSINVFFHGVFAINVAFGTTYKCEKKAAIGVAGNKSVAERLTLILITRITFFLIKILPNYLLMKVLISSKMPRRQHAAICNHKSFKIKSILSIKLLGYN
jgi:hypothetical protein